MLHTDHLGEVQLGVNEGHPSQLAGLQAPWEALLANG